MNTDKIQWTKAFPDNVICSGDIHVWRASLDLEDDQRKNLVENLSGDEIARVARFRFEKDKNRFIAARGILRQLLGFYMCEPPKDISIAYTVYGKPVLAINAHSHSLCFNLSHAGAYALYTFTRNRNIGVDIERVHDDIAAGHIAQRFFSPGEIANLEKTPETERNRLFFKYWTRKEAFLKAKGAGLSFSMEQCDVSLMSGSDWSPVLFTGNDHSKLGFNGIDLCPLDGYVGAVVVEGGDSHLSYWQYVV